MSEGEYKYFRDPVHGYIEVNLLELSIIDLPIFQRLRYIRQLGCTYLLYHGADHTRFAHSLGAMHVASQMIDHLRRNCPKCISDNEAELVRLAALLHDIGHPPFSHSLEEVLRKAYKDDGKHEAYSKKMILESEISDLMDKEGVDPEKVARIVVGKYPNTLVTQILHSPLSADRMDYLLRDSLFCGVKYGMFDIDRLMISLWEKDGNLAIHEKGEHAFLGYVLARFYMYAQVYAHKTRRAADLMLGRLFQNLISTKISFPSSAEISPEKFASLDDSWFLHELRDVARLGSSQSDSELANMFLKRGLLKVAEAAEEYVGSGREKASDRFVRLRMLMSEDERRVLADLVGIDPDRIIVDRPDQSVTGYKPFTVGAEAEQIYILKKDGTIYNPFLDPSKLFHDLASKELLMVRIYGYPKEYERIREGLKTYLGD